MPIPTLKAMPNISAFRQFAQNIINACDEYERAVKEVPEKDSMSSSDE